MTGSKIEAEALSLLLKQKLAGRFALYFLDFRHIVTGGRALISSISEYESSVGEKLPFRPEGFTVQKGNISLILYDDHISNRLRQNWTIAHELGHIFLSHTSDGKKQQNEANRFAAALLIPEAVVRFLDCSLGRDILPEEMTRYFPASFTACSKRRAELRGTDYFPTDAGAELVKRLFSPGSAAPSEALSDFENAVFFK